MLSCRYAAFIIVGYLASTAPACGGLITYTVSGRFDASLSGDEVLDQTLGLGLHGADYTVTATIDSNAAPSFSSSTPFQSSDYDLASLTLQLSNTAGNAHDGLYANSILEGALRLRSFPDPPLDNDILELAPGFTVGGTLLVFSSQVLFNDNNFLQGDPLQLPVFQPSDVSIVRSFGSYLTEPDLMEVRFFSVNDSASAVVPEPSSLALLGLGSLTLWGFRRRCRRKTEMVAS